MNFHQMNQPPALNLDTDMLKQLVSSRLNRDCVLTRVLTRGYYNEIHLLQFNDGPDCIARLSRIRIHPPEKFASEVATMKYVAQNTSIRVPKVYDWDCTVQNPIKIPYILMERLPGQHLYQVWNDLTVEKRKCVLSQIVNVLHELWTKCHFEEIGSLYMNNRLQSDSFMAMSDFQIGPIVNSLFYIEGRNTTPSSTGPFESLRELFNALIQKEKNFFKIHGVQELLKMNIDQRMAERRVTNLVKLLDLLQSKLLNIFDESISQKPFTLVHGDFDAQNILVERSVNDDIKIVGIVDWEFSRTGTLWDLCQYPIWIQEVEEPFRDLSDIELKRNREKQKLREFFYNEMISKLGNRSGQILKMKERDRRFGEFKDILTLMVHRLVDLESLLKNFFNRYGSEVQAYIQYFDDPIKRHFWSPKKMSYIRVQAPSKQTIDCLLSKDKLSNEFKVPMLYRASLYCELESKGYKYSWKQISAVASHMWENETRVFKQAYMKLVDNVYNDTNEEIFTIKKL